jgi:hypothetical protein
MWYVGSLCAFTALIFYRRGIYKYYLVTLTPMWAIYSAFVPLNYKNWRIASNQRLKQIITQPKTNVYQIYGGGTFLHFLIQYGLQLLIMWYNKWLAVLFLYFPLLMFGVISLIYQSRQSPSEKIIEAINQYRREIPFNRRKNRKILKRKAVVAKNPETKIIYEKLSQLSFPFRKTQTFHDYLDKINHIFLQIKNKIIQTIHKEDKLGNTV